MNRKLDQLNRNEIKKHILSLQLEVKEQIAKQNNVDDFLDKTDIFDEFEEILPDKEFGVLVLTILNNFKSEVILEDILNIIEEAIKKIKYNNE